MPMIETEIRSFITPEKYNELLDYFRKNAEFILKDDQETYYFDCEQDLRIQRNSFFSKIWMKKGKIHDEFREEIEIRFPREDFEKLEKLFLALGFKVKIKWFRNRHEFEWDDIKVCLDYTKGYGYIIELEKLCSDGQKEKILAELKSKMNEIGVAITPREEFDTKFSYYEKNWKRLTKE